MHLEKPNTSGVPDYVLGDPDRLRGILLNLYTNAAKFTKRGSIALRVRVANKDYRPSSAQAIVQQQRGPHAVQHHCSGSHAVHEEAVAQQSSSSWGAITAGSAQRGLSAPIPRLSPQACNPSGRDTAHRTPPPEASQAGSSGPNLAGDEVSDVAVRNPNQARAEGPGIQAAADAFMAIQQGQHAHKAAEAIGSVSRITTPVACEHVAGHVLLQHTVQVIEKAANKMQADAGLTPLGANKAQAKLGSGMLVRDPLQVMEQDHSGDSGIPQRRFESQFSQPRDSCLASRIRSNSSDSSHYQRSSKHLDSEVGGQASSSNRISNSSVLDLPEESSSSGGSSSPSESKQELEGQADHDNSQQHQPDHLQQVCMDAVVDGFHTHTSTMQAASPPCRQSRASDSRQSGTLLRSGLGERSRSDSDVTETDAPYRYSDSSFSDYPSPIRKSFSSPQEALNTAADAAAAAHRASGTFTATSYNGMSAGKATVGKEVATAVQDLGNGWFSTVAHWEAPVLAGTSSARSSSASDASLPTAPATIDEVKASPFQQAPSPAGEFLVGCHVGCLQGAYLPVLSTCLHSLAKCILKHSHYG